MNMLEISPLVPILVSRCTERSGAPIPEPRYPQLTGGMKVMLKKLALVLCLLAAALPARADEMVPIQPCRVLDTRNTAVGYLAAGTVLDFAVRTAPAAPGPSQGGQSGCGIPYNATAVQLNIVAVQPNSAGHAILWPYGTAQPITSVLNVSALTTENTGTFGLLAPTGATKDLSFRPIGFATFVVVDITGYAVPSTATLVGQATGILFGTTLVVETAGGVSVKVFAPDSLPTFKASWLSAIGAAVDNCVHIDGLWHYATSTIEYNTVEARSLPLVMPGYCGPG